MQDEKVRAVHSYHSNPRWILSEIQSTSGSVNIFLWENNSADCVRACYRNMYLYCIEIRFAVQKTTITVMTGKYDWVLWTRVFNLFALVKQIQFPIITE